VVAGSFQTAFAESGTATRESGVARPRILLVLTEFPPRIGGMQTHAVYLSTWLAGRGYPIEVVTYRPDDVEESGAAQSYDSRFSFPVRRCLSRLGFWKNLDQIGEIAAEFRPDLVYASTVFYGFLGPRLGVPVVCRSVGNDVLRPWIAYPFRLGSRLLSNPAVERYLYRTFQRLEQPEFVAALFRAARHRLMERSAREMTRILANSTYTAALLRQVGVPDERIELLVGGVDTARFTRPDSSRARLRREIGLPADRYLLLTACRLEPKKGIDFLLESFAHLRRSMPDAFLVIVGEGKSGRRCREQAKRLGLDDDVRFVGRVPHDGVHRYFWAADLFVLASREYRHARTGLRDAETMGRVLCEANAAGLPVVAARSGGIPSVVADGENGLLFEPDNQTDFLSKVLMVRRRPELSARLVAGGKRAARERFDWANILDAHERIFVEVRSATIGD
jgi:phosphatidyl-myo-inositol dimannoside synthase